MAPEIEETGNQTDKVDVWGLFVTLIWTLDTEGFRKNEIAGNFKSMKEVYRAISMAVPHVSNIAEMARENPEQRASAAQMLVKCFNGKGLTTPGNQVPALIDDKGPSKQPPNLEDPKVLQKSKPLQPRRLQRRGRVWPTGLRRSIRDPRHHDRGIVRVRSSNRMLTRLSTTNFDNINLRLKHIQ